MSVARTWRLIAAFILADRFTDSPRRPRLGNPRRRTCAAGSIRGSCPIGGPLPHPPARGENGRRARARERQRHGREMYALKAMGEGLWEVTIGPIRSGFHYTNWLSTATR